jgi:hypothetical protein
MKQILIVVSVALFLLSCSSKNESVPAEKTVVAADTLQYAYKATYSSDLTVPSNPANAQMVLKIWKLFEGKQFDSVKFFYADTVTYNNSGGFHFYGSSAQLLDYAKKDFESLDSLRFDLSMWQSVHINDRNEDWVYIWATERRYEKGKGDTSLMHEQWQVKNNKVCFFNQYSAKYIK